MRTRLTIGIVCTLLVTFSVDLHADEYDEARREWQSGRYARALEGFEAIQEMEGEAGDRIAIGRAEALESMGRIDEAVDVLINATETDSPSAEVLAKRAELEFNRGNHDAAESLASEAIEIDRLCRKARWVMAELLDVKGQRDEAIEAYRWFVRDYNARADEARSDAEDLCLIGQAAERYYRAIARGEELAETLNDIINDIYERALQVDPQCWQAAWLQGRLFFEGYRQGDARRELSRALLINPSATEVIVTLGEIDLENYALNDGRKKAETAIEINPSYAPAYVLLADLNIADERFPEALEAAEQGVTCSPRDLGALARLGASYHLLGEPLGVATTEAIARANTPNPSEYYTALGQRLSDRRKYPPAERALLEAIKTAPELPRPKIALAMLYMQIGREAEARTLFELAYDADPFNVRADNMLKVLERMESYEEIETEHYTVLIKPPTDRLLGRYMADFLESIHPEMVARFGFEPPGKTSIQILEDQETFSGRTTAQRFIPTVGACTGTVVALTSPTSTGGRFNWSRVLTHEVAHVITLQQTNFNIPHWYTEALAVESEKQVRPQAWNKLLVDRVPDRNLLNLETINLGFIRPEDPDQRQLAYCQAQLYARYMVERFGEDALARLLDAYRRGRATPDAVVDTFEVTVEDFEAGYLKYLDRVVSTIRTRVEDEEPVSFSRLLLDLRKKPDDADLNARVAYEFFARREYKEARPYAEKALELEPHQALASYVKARILMFIGEESTALELLKPALDEERPNERVLDLLAELTMKDNDLGEAERLYELARRDDPLNSKWIAGLARVHLRQGKTDAFLDDLAILANNDADDRAIRQALAERHLALEEYEEAARWAQECLYIKVDEVKPHVVLADALAGLGRFEEAVREYEVALGLKPENPQAIQEKLQEARASLEPTASENQK